MDRFEMVRRYQEAWVWLAIIALAFLSVSLSLWSLHEAAVQYWYLYFAPLVLAAIRFGLRGALAGSAAILVSLLLLYQFAVDVTAPSLQLLEQLIGAATSPSELQSLAFRMADLRARDPSASFARALTGSILLVSGSILVGRITDRGRVQERQHQEAFFRVREHLARFFSPSLVDAIMTGHQELALSTARKELTVLFSDLRGFTSLSERVEAEELTRILNEYLEAMTGVVFAHGGTLDKYMGDSVMAFFGDPLPYEDHQERAIRCALAMRERFVELRSRWMIEGRDAINQGIGIHSGFVTVGTFGSRTRMDYTVIGANVNLASRLCSMAGPGQVLTSTRTLWPVKHLVDGRTIGNVEVKGIAHPVEIQEVLGYRVLAARNGVSGDRAEAELHHVMGQIVEDGSFRAFVIGSPDRALADTALSAEERDLIQQVAVLKGYPLFRGVPAKEILYLVQRATREEPGDGIVITRQGEKEGVFYLIYRGEATVLVTDQLGRDLHIATLGRGNHFGEMALLYDRPRNATIRAGHGLVLLVLDEERFRELLEAAPVLGENIQDEARRRLAV